jgi:alkylated DNA repair dioxygenase AlkB
MHCAPSLVQFNNVLVTKLIASVRLGEVRAFIMSPNVITEGDSVERATKRWDLAKGSLFLMQGDTQANWKVELFSGPRCNFALLIE